MATGCKLKLTWAPFGQVDDALINDTLAETYKSFMKKEGVHFEPRAVEEQIPGASSDFGNITYVVPGLQPGQVVSI